MRSFITTINAYILPTAKLAPWMTCVALAGTFALQGCVEDAGEAETGTSASELRSDARSAGIVEGTPDAKAIVAVANDRTLVATDYVRRFGMTRATAAQLIQIRLGDANGVDNFDKVQEIDVLPGTTATVFTRMVAFAKLNPAKYYPVTVVDPTDPASCAGPAISKEKLQALFNNGKSRIALPSVAAQVFKRDINALGSASAWTPAPAFTWRYFAYSSGGGVEYTGSLAFDTATPVMTLAPDGQVFMHFGSASAVTGLELNSPSLSQYFFGRTAVGFGAANCATEAGVVKCPELQTVDSASYSATSPTWFAWRNYGSGWTLTGNLTDTCFRVSATDKQPTSETMLDIAGKIE